MLRAHPPGGPQTDTFPSCLAASIVLSQSVFDAAAKDIVGAFHFEPGRLNARRTAVFTYLTITFNGRGERALGSNIRAPVTVDSRVNRMCAVEGFDFGQEYPGFRLAPQLGL